MATRKKVYMLIWVSGTATQFIEKGPCALLNFKREKLKKQNQYKGGKLIVISEDGYKYHLKPELKPSEL